MFRVLTPETKQVLGLDVEPVALALILASLRPGQWIPLPLGSRDVVHTNSK